MDDLSKITKEGNDNKILIYQILILIFYLAILIDLFISNVNGIHSESSNETIIWENSLFFRHYTGFPCGKAHFFKSNFVFVMALFSPIFGGVGELLKKNINIKKSVPLLTYFFAMPVLSTWGGHDSLNFFIIISIISFVFSILYLKVHKSNKSNNNQQAIIFPLLILGFYQFFIFVIAIFSAYCS